VLPRSFDEIAGKLRSGQHDGEPSSPESALEPANAAGEKSCAEEQKRDADEAAKRHKFTNGMQADSTTTPGRARCRAKAALLRRDPHFAA
jgi:hypothetical protein